MPPKKIYNSIAAVTTCGVKTAADQKGRREIMRWLTDGQQHRTASAITKN